MRQDLTLLLKGLWIYSILSISRSTHIKYILPCNISNNDYENLHNKHGNNQGLCDKREDHCLSQQESQ